MDSSNRMPAVFVGHGSPMNTLEQNRWTESWADLGRALPQPRAIVAISAHWYINATAVTAMAEPSTIHDFFGFPEELFAVQYGAPGSPELAHEIAEVAKPTWVGLDRDSWGFDHGTWSVLTHMYPEADVPVVQLSVDAGKPAHYHVDLGAKLAPLRDDGVLFVASGNVLHNLAMMDPSQPDTAFAWGEAYDEAATELMTVRPGDIATLYEHEHHHLAAPTPDHLLPVFYVAGMAAEAGATAEVFTDGYLMGSLSMTSYLLR